MKRVLYFSALLGVFLLIYKPQWKLKTASSDLPTSGAGIAMDAWTLERLYPSNHLKKEVKQLQLEINCQHGKH